MFCSQTMRASVSLVGLAALLMVSGCQPEVPYQTVPARGKLTLDGKIPEGGTRIVFVPIDESGKPREGLPQSMSVTNMRGEFAVGTKTRDAGAVPGRHTALLFLKKDDVKAAGQFGADVSPDSGPGDGAGYNPIAPLTVVVPEGGVKDLVLEFRTNPPESGEGDSGEADATETATSGGAGSGGG